MRRTKIPGVDAWPMLDMFLKKFGLRQSFLAKKCGVRPQILTDIKSGRRYFSKKMADALLAASQGEPWEFWVRHMLDNAFNPPKYEGLEEFFEDMDEDAPEATKVPMNSLPILTTPCLGDPFESNAYYGERISVAEAIAELALSTEPAYVLRLHSDDVFKRLRSGDLLLVSQTADAEKEIMVVDHMGMLKLARSLTHSRIFYGFSDYKERKEGWLALDSGILLLEAEPVSCVIGIVWADL